MCLIFWLGPGGVIGLPGGGSWPFAGRICFDAFGVSFSTAASDGNVRMPPIPKVLFGRYLKRNAGSAPAVAEPVSSGRVSPGCAAFGPEPSPFAASHTRFPRRGPESACTGYEPTGIRPTSANRFAAGRAGVRRTAASARSSSSSP